MAARRVGKLVPSKTVFFECDIQERFRDLIYNMPAVISTAEFLLQVSKELNVPCIATEQSPKNLLHTVQELNIGMEPNQVKAKIFEKEKFSMWVPDVKNHLLALSKERDMGDAEKMGVVLFGIEAHVCITQTCLDLLEEDYDVHVVCDGVSSQKPHDRVVALQRMQQAGAFLTTAEQVTFQLLGTSNKTEAPKFKAVSNLVKRRNREGINTFSTMSTL